MYRVTRSSTTHTETLPLCHLWVSSDEMIGTLERSFPIPDDHHQIPTIEMKKFVVSVPLPTRVLSKHRRISPSLEDAQALTVGKSVGCDIDTIKVPQVILGPQSSNNSPPAPEHIRSVDRTRGSTSCFTCIVSAYRS